MPPMPPNPNNKQQPGGRQAALINAEKPKNARETLGKLLRYIGRSQYLFFGLMAVMLMITMLGLAAPYIQQIAIDCITLDDKKLSVDTERLIKILIVLGVVYLMNSVFSYLQGIFSARLSQKTVSTMRRDLFGDLVKLPIKYFDSHRHGDIMSRMTNDVENISNTVSQSIGSLISGVLTVIGSIVIMWTYSPLLTLISLSTVVLTVFVSAKMTKYMRRYFLKQQIILGKLNGHVEEMVTGHRTVVSYSKEQAAVEDFNVMSDELRRTGIRAQICAGIMGPLMNCIGNFGFVMIAAFGGWFSYKGWITVGTIQAFILYSKQFSRPINEIANQYANIQTAIAGAERIFEVMETPPETDEGTSKITAEDIRGDIKFEDIHFSYDPEKPVLKGLDLDIKQGQKIAIVGATGSGKTTVVNLLTRFYDADSGSITVDGVDIRDMRMDELRKSVGIVLQDTVLFKGSIEDNIRYGREDAPDEDVRRAAAHANADVFIRHLPEGYKTQLAEGGSNRL